MLRCLTSQAIRLACRQVPVLSETIIKTQPRGFLQMHQQARFICLGMHPTISSQYDFLNRNQLDRFNHPKPVASPLVQPLRLFHAKGSKVRYMDFRFKLNTSHLRSHLLIIRRQKMKKHQRAKWRKKYKCMLAKQRLKREIAKEKTFRVELLTMIKKAEQFNPKEYAFNKINEINNKPKEFTREEQLEEIKEKIRVNRYQVTYIKPKHKRIETFGLDL